jgi:hypothetical protein
VLRVNGYDLDGVLRAPDGSVLHRPEEPRFHVITARAEAKRAETAAWLETHFPGRVAGLEMRSLPLAWPEGIVAWKARRILTLGLDRFVDDSPDVVEGLRVALDGRAAVVLGPPGGAGPP